VQLIGHAHGSDAITSPDFPPRLNGMTALSKGYAVEFAASKKSETKQR
jgi:hypothetical protein